MPADMLTPEELAARWGISPYTLAGRRQHGEGPPFLKLGHRTVRYRLEDVEAFEAASRSGRPVEDPAGYAA
jgi:Helix-turn-helix domain